ncbi:MAG: hypothetical protein Q4D32_05115 [Eubacteriales bacterium]|nr:hypothetical protein [Eubacteriales bacterium]
MSISTAASAEMAGPPVRDSLASFGVWVLAAEGEAEVAGVFDGVSVVAGAGVSPASRRAGVVSIESHNENTSIRAQCL